MTRLPRSLRERSVARFAALLALIGCCGLVVLLAPLPEMRTAPALVARLGPAYPVIAVAVGALLLVALVPRTFVTVTWGALFGPVAGAGYSLAAAGLAAAAGFALGRWLGREFVAERVRGRLAKLDRWFADQSVVGVVTVRLLPISGYGLVSYGYGTTGARMAPFLVGSVLAAAPTAFGYAALGAAVMSSDPGVHVLTVAPAGLGLVATAAVLWRWRRAVRAAPPQGRAPAGSTTDTGGTGVLRAPR